MNDRNSAGPLAGIRVLDVGQIVAGPFAATLLADYGADVVKVERPGKGDPLRALGREKDGVPLWWHVCNRNKRTIALDLGQEADRDIFRRLARQADVLVENFVPGTLKRLGLDYEELAQSNPGLVMLQVSGFGQDGPYSRWPGFARTSEAFSGLTHLTGFPDRPPVNVSAFTLSDYVAGLFGAFAIVSALRERDQVSGRGQIIDLALNEGLFRMMENLCVTYDQLGLLSQRTGGAHEQAYPVGIWPSRDGVPIQLAVGTDLMARKFFAVIGHPSLIDDPRFASNTARVENKEALAPIVAAWFGGCTGAQALQTLGDAGIAVSPVMTMDAIFKDPHYAARGSLVEVEDERLGKVVMPAVIPKLSRTPGQVRHGAHAIDADRQGILADWLAAPDSIRPAQKNALAPQTQQQRTTAVVNPKLLPSDAVVIFADLHKGIVELPLTVAPADLLRSVEGLATLADLFDLPTLALSIPKLTGEAVEFVPEITSVRKTFQHLQRTSPDSFENAAIRETLARTGRSTLVVCGVATEVAVHWLVISGIANGYKVYVVADACGGISARSEDAAFRRFTAAGAVMTSVASLAGELSGDFTRPIGREAVEVIYKMIGVPGPRKS